MSLEEAIAGLTAEMKRFNDFTSVARGAVDPTSAAAAPAKAPAAKAAAKAPKETAPPAEKAPTLEELQATAIELVKLTGDRDALVSTFWNPLGANKAAEVKEGDRAKVLAQLKAAIEAHKAENPEV